MSFHDGISGRRSGRNAQAPGEGDGPHCGLACATLVATRSGPVAAARLRPGDLILTRDNGYRPLLWSGHGRRGAAGGGGGHSVAIAPDTLGPGLPERTLRLAASHGLLVDAHSLLPVLGTIEALVPAGTIGQRLPNRPPGGFVQIVLASHELILADGAWVESLAPLAAFHVFPRQALGFTDVLRAMDQTVLRPRIEPAGPGPHAPAVQPPGGEARPKRNFRVA